MFNISDFYTQAFVNKPSLDRSFEKILDIEISQESVKENYPETDAKYLTSCLRKLKETKNLRTLIITFLLTYYVKKSISTTVKNTSFGYLFHLTRLVILELRFDDLLNHQKAAIWRTMQQNHKTLMQVKLYFSSISYRLLPVFEGDKVVDLNILQVGNISVRDLFMFGKFRYSWIVRDLILDDIRQPEKMTPEGKYFLACLMQKDMIFSIDFLKSFALNDHYIKLNQFLQSS